MNRETFTAWAKRIDRMAIRAALAEPGASYIHRFGSRSHWRELYDGGLTPEAA